MEGAFADQVGPGAVPFEPDRARLEIVVDQVDQPVPLAVRHGAEKDAFAVPRERNRQRRNVTVKLGEELLRGESRRFFGVGENRQGIVVLVVRQAFGIAGDPSARGGEAFQPSKASRVMFFAPTANRSFTPPDSPRASRRSERNRTR